MPQQRPLFIFLFMPLTTQINTDLKDAMKTGNKVRLETLRSIRAAILDFEKSGVDREMTPDDELKILNSAAKKRKDAIDIYEKNGRQEAADKERMELDIIMSYLPKQLTESEIRDIIKEIIISLNATQPSDLGKVMGSAMKQLKGRADGNVIQSVAKSLLGAA